MRGETTAALLPACCWTAGRTGGEGGRLGLVSARDADIHTLGSGSDPACTKPATAVTAGTATTAGGCQQPIAVLLGWRARARAGNQWRRGIGEATTKTRPRRWKLVLGESLSVPGLFVCGVGNVWMGGVKWSKITDRGDLLKECGSLPAVGNRYGINRVPLAGPSPLSGECTLLCMAGHTASGIRPA